MPPFAFGSSWGGVHQFQVKPQCQQRSHSHEPTCQRGCNAAAVYTVHSSEYESSWDPLLLSETDARGSDECPCRAYHPLTFPRDGHLPSHDATGSDEFPVKPVVTEWEGLDEMGPWLRVKDTDRLLLGDRTVHWSPDCPFLSGRSFGLTQCYCADKLHKCFHYDVDDNFCLHGNSRCHENVDVVAGVVWPVVVMCRWCCPFPVSPY